jgi:putative PIN family toxin of toxin-antitoxin system
MRLVVDANVFVSGVFFSGPPFLILDAWRNGGVDIIVTPDILSEYERTGAELSAAFPAVDLTPWLRLLATKAVVIEAPALPERVCADADDDKFLACALAGRVATITTGDKALLRVSGFRGARCSLHASSLTAI